jgi:hypothetical protein
LAELALRLSSANIGAARSALADVDPIVRIGALDMLANVPAGHVWPWAAALLSDPVRGVRIRAASLLAAVLTPSQPQSDRERFERAATEFVDAQRSTPSGPKLAPGWGAFSLGAVSQSARRPSTRLRCNSARNSSPRQSISLSFTGNSAGTMKKKQLKEEQARLSVELFAVRMTALRLSSGGEMALQSSHSTIPSCAGSVSQPNGSTTVL